MGLTYVVSAPGVFYGIAFAFACLLDIGLLDILCGGAFKFFSSGPTKASTAGMNAGTGRTVFLFVMRMSRALCADGSLHFTPVQITLLVLLHGLHLLVVFGSSLVLLCLFH